MHPVVHSFRVYRPLPCDSMHLLSSPCVELIRLVSLYDRRRQHKRRPPCPKTVGIQRAGNGLAKPGAGACLSGDCRTGYCVGSTLALLPRKRCLLRARAMAGNDIYFGLIWR